MVLAQLQDCQAGRRLEAYIIRGGGHNWPGNDSFIPESIAGQVSIDINASEVTWDFYVGP